MWKSWIFKHALLHIDFFTSEFLGFQYYFFHLFTYPLIYRSLFVSYVAHIVYSYSYLEKVLLPAFTIPEMESERKISLRFYICRLFWSIYLILCYYSINLCNYFWYICYLLALCFRRRHGETFPLLKCFYSRELGHISFQANVPPT